MNDGTEAGRTRGPSAPEGAEAARGRASQRGSTLLETQGACFGYGRPGRFLHFGLFDGFGSKAGIPGPGGAGDAWVVRDVDLRLAPGDFVALVGRNGCGKTTVLRGLLGLVPRMDGIIRWSVPRSRLGYVPQEAPLERDVPATALDVVRSGAPASWSRNRDAAREVLRQVGLENRAETRFGRLSGGQRRRVLIGRALMGEPALLLMDEPTVNVDRETEEAMEALIEDLRRRGMAVLVTTHAHHWASQACRLLVEGGRIHA